MQNLVVNRFAAALLYILATVTPSKAQNLTEQELSKELSSIILSKHQDFISDFVEVFLGHINCQYSFVDEDVFNQLADQRIVRASTEVAEWYQAHSSDLPIDEGLAERLAKIQAMALIDVLASHHDAVFSAQNNFDEQNCMALGEQHMNMYQNLINRADQQ